MNENQIYTAHILICKRKLRRHLPRLWDPRKMVNGKKKRKIVKRVVKSFSGQDTAVLVSKKLPLPAPGNNKTGPLTNVA